MTSPVTKPRTTEITVAAAMLPMLEAMSPLELTGCQEGGQRARHLGGRDQHRRRNDLEAAQRLDQRDEADDHAEPDAAFIRHRNGRSHALH